MSRPSNRSTAIAVAVLILLGVFTRVRADDGLKTINNPGGGQIVYGPVRGVSSLQGAMVTVLRTVHSRFGSRPQIGRFFQARDSQSIATFFTLSAKGAGPVAGLVIVSMPQGGKATAAVLYDNAARFTKTEPAMMQTLNQAWHADSAKPARPAAVSAKAPQTASAAAPVRQTGSQHLRKVTGGDRSASIDLPAGWKVTGVGGGQLTAEGPNGEMVGLGLILQQIHDARSRQPTYGSADGTAPLVYPYGGNLFDAFVSITNQLRRNARMSEGAFKLIKSENLPANQYEPQVIQAVFEVDLHDGKGPRKGSARVGAMPSGNGFPWALTVSSSNVPIKFADAENSMMMAIIQSYSQDSNVIAQETQQVIGRIHAEQRANQIRADAQSEINDSRSHEFEAHMDDIDRSSKSFQNYQLDREVIQDNDYNERATTGSGLGDALINADPDRFEYVQSQDFIKGVDY